MFLISVEFIISWRLNSKLCYKLQQKIFHKCSNAKVNASFITLIYPLNKVKFKLSKSRTSGDFIGHHRNIKRYVIKNKAKRFILVIDNASFHVSRKTVKFIDFSAASFIRGPNFFVSCTLPFVSLSVAGQLLIFSSYSYYT